MGKPGTDWHRVEVIDSLRGLAAMAVVLYHFVGYLTLFEIPLSLPGSAIVAMAKYGYLGVMVFFVVSGFVIAMTSSRYVFTAVTGSRFILRRLIRIAPPYWATVLLFTTLIVAGHVAGFFQNTFVTPAQVIAHLSYAQDILGFVSLNVAFWTLCLEVQFYLVFAVTLVLLHSRSPTTQVGGFAILTAMSFVFATLDLVPQAWFPRLWYQFGVGVLTYFAAANRTARFALAVLLVLILGFGVYQGEASGIVVPVVAVLLLLRRQTSVVAVARLRSLQWLGQISYSLYLVHGLGGLALGIWFRATSHSEAASWVAIAAATTLTTVMAAVFYQLCEKPAVGWAHGVRVGPPRELSPAAATGGDLTHTMQTSQSRHVKNK